MSKKTSLAAALQTYDRAPVAVATVPAERSRQSRAKEQGRAHSAQAPSRAGKKALIGYFDPGVSKQLKQMALDGDRTVQDLLSEALNDFFQKHKKSTIA
jgi:transaldolase